MEIIGIPTTKIIKIELYFETENISEKNNQINPHKCIPNNH